ncbi:hypothetical protein C7999DRAFT_28771 [Corynascus novoguineensis]|uniref:DUF1754-domain-containing protein n=1 Tax=Corynascus novoguineensis TaxID=1126955 RepID=A0AAN7CZ79_9PEZI|nr:hypothetical protein C7999DRAFT_28771 [Corynascus novoguineensis]
MAIDKAPLGPLRPLHNHAASRFAVDTNVRLFTPTRQDRNRLPPLVIMPPDEYTSIARGPLKLKGVAGVTKKKKKKDKGKTTDLEKNLSTGGSSRDSSESALVPAEKEDAPGSSADKERRSPTEEDRGELQQKQDETAADDDLKTETERRFLEAKRKRLKELAESGRIRPELLKTHKQRVEELNAHLARLSEHHDMPKIGPG